MACLCLAKLYNVFLQIRGRRYYVVLANWRYSCRESPYFLITGTIIRAARARLLFLDSTLNASFNLRK